MVFNKVKSIYYKWDTNINTLKLFSTVQDIEKVARVHCDISESSWVPDGSGHSVELTEMKLALGVPHHVPQRHKSTNSLDRWENKCLVNVKSNPLKSIHWQTQATEKNPQPVNPPDRVSSRQGRCGRLSPVAVLEWSRWKAGRGWVGTAVGCWATKIQPTLGPKTQTL